jgi:uncharacterized protein YijF (DUF1287 family)
MNRRQFLLSASAALLSFNALAKKPPMPAGLRLVDAARKQIGVTLIYDPAYKRIPYPNGDVPRRFGVCADVVVRAYRDAFHYDLQRAVHEDMKAAFNLYPRTWNLKRPDPNIDHRRVLNLQTFFQRHGKALPVTRNSKDYSPGDIVTQMLPGNLPHIMIVSNRWNDTSTNPLVIHNVGMGTREEDFLFKAKITGHFRFFPKAK